MTPKEKAKELCCKYADALNIRDLQTTANPFAKQSALIAVAEIMKMPNIGYSNNKDESQYDYWEAVKAEIEKL